MPRSTSTTRFHTLLPLLAVGLLLFISPAAAQSNGNGNGMQPRMPARNGFPAVESNDVPSTENSPSHDPKLEEARKRSRELERQRRMVDDANRLVQLAARYRAMRGM